MDPTNVSGSYAQYKSKQAKFTTWLKQTAGKSTAYRECPKSKTPSSSTYLVHYTELQALAECVVETASSSESIPLDMIFTQRKEFSRMYCLKEKTDGRLRAGKQRHQHIILVLEKVLCLLKRTLLPATHTKFRPGDTPTQRISTTEFSNLPIKVPQSHESDSDSDDAEGARVITDFRSRNNFSKKQGKRTSKHKRTREQQSIEQDTSDGVYSYSGQDYDIDLADEEGDI